MNTPHQALATISCLLTALPCMGAEDALAAMEIFPYVVQHVHGSTIVELPNGDLLAAWFQGSGERWADDVAIMGSRLRPGETQWSEPFVMADTPGFPDINPILFMDGQSRLWLMWYTVIANQWETSLLKYRISEDWTRDEGPPQWAWQDVLHVKPGDKAERGIQPNDRFARSVERQIKEYAEYVSGQTMNPTSTAGATTARIKTWSDDLLAKARGQDMVRKGILVDDAGRGVDQPLGYPYFRRMGWQTKNKAVVLAAGRIVVPLYSDGFSFSLMALTDDGGRTWTFSEPLVGGGNIQPSIATQPDGTLVAYMRDNGPPPARLHVSRSADAGATWSSVRDSELPNPGSGADVVTLANGHWVWPQRTDVAPRRLTVERPGPDLDPHSASGAGPAGTGCDPEPLPVDHPGARRGPSRGLQLSSQRPGTGPCQNHQICQIHRKLAPGNE